MEAKLKELEGQQSRASEAFDSQLEMLRTANIKLKNKYERALDQVEELKIENETRITEMKNDFEKMSSNFTKKLQHLQKEKKSLTADYEQLALASQRDREALQQLIARTKKQDEVILAQQESINNKDNKLANMLKEHNNLKEQIKLTEQKMNLGENGLEKQKVLISELNSQIENLKTQLQHEREESIRNDGTIDQHICKIEQLQLELTNTEEKLKKALEEWRIASEEAKKAMEQLHIISSKLQIYEAKSETMQKSLGEEQVKVSEGGDAESLSEKVITVSGQFERKIALMEQQKQLELDLVLKEKDQAVYAAKFSTQKLLETVTDFQKQVDVHKQIQLMLAKVLQEKEECIESIQTTCPPCPGNPNAVRKKSKGKGCRSNSCPYR
ncbi:hypothetical protein RI129_006802 [Pyrocoelia pectoralis]|uniref:Uncharacterized protein n=1 Tax=Pyrocoelia pectoralis TaxID=417401 RepID=A0AAN7ZJZ6_9COLE